MYNYMENNNPMNKNTITFNYGEFKIRHFDTDYQFNNKAYIWFSNLQEKYNKKHNDTNNNQRPEKYIDETSINEK